MTTDIDTGVRGAKRQSWKAANPRELLKRVIDDNPGADREGLLHLFRDQMWQEDEAEEYVDTIIEYWFANNYHSLVGPLPALPRSREARSRTVELAQEIKAKVKAKILERAAIVLSDMVLPNGKRLADCTGRECLSMSGALGGLIAKIADKVKPSQVVGQVLTEQQLQDMYVGKTS
jgi:hypothetical protein